jgi:trans-aconitate methyltransferase
MQLTPSEAASAIYDWLIGTKTTTDATRAVGGYNYARVERFARRLRPLARVMDLGSGIGAVTSYLTRRGFDALGVDISGEFIRVARTLFPDCTFVHADFTQLQPEDVEPLGGVYERLALMNVPREGILLMFEKIHRMLEPDGLLQTTFEIDAPEESGWRVIPTAESQNAKWFYTHFYTPALLVQDLTSSRFRILDVRIEA